MIMKGSTGIKAGDWRSHEEPMQVVSGPIGREKIHYEAPPSSRVPEEMRHFIAWFNDTGPNGKKEIKKPAVRAAITHLYFEGGMSAKKYISNYAHFKSHSNKGFTRPGGKRGVHSFWRRTEYAL